MIWRLEFENFASCDAYIVQRIAQANKQLEPYQRKLNYKAVDIADPEPFKQGHNLLVTHNWLAPGQLDPARYEQFPSSYYAIYAGEAQTESQIPIKKFNCFSNRMDPIRQSWFYQLIRRGVFDQGYVSFNMDISRHIEMRQYDPMVTAEQVFENQFKQYLEIFAPEHELAKKIVPYLNFTQDLQKVIMQTEFSVVLETYFDNNQMITFSEKIFRCLKLPRPWLLFAMKNAVAHLRDIGFDVLDDLVNHDYDSVEFTIERQIMLLDQIELMCKKTLTTAQIARCQQAADHNQALLDTMLKNFHNDVDKTCSRALDKCKQLS